MGGNMNIKPCNCGDPELVDNTFGFGKVMRAQPITTSAFTAVLESVHTTASKKPLEGWNKGY